MPQLIVALCARFPAGHFITGAKLSNWGEFPIFHAKLPSRNDFALLAGLRDLQTMP